MSQEDLQCVCVVMGNDSPVVVLVNFLASTMKGQTEHFCALHLVDPVDVSVDSGFSLALTRRSRIFLGLRKEMMGGEENTSFSVSSECRMDMWVETILEILLKNGL